MSKYSKLIYFWVCTLFLNFFCQQALARHVLCGSDEDGCVEGAYQYCFCIPYDSAQVGSKFCLDIAALQCRPASSTEPCQSAHLAFNNQETCLAVLFQSTPRRSCVLVEDAFCQKNNVPICDKNGKLSSCRG